jgi:hypothetical protein
MRSDRPHPSEWEDRSCDPDSLTPSTFACRAGSCYGFEAHRPAKPPPSPLSQPFLAVHSGETNHLGRACRRVRHACCSPRRQ